MKSSELKRQLAQALEHASADNFDKVLCRCQPQKGTVIVMNEPKKRTLRLPIVVAVAACFALLVVGVGVFTRIQSQSLAIASVISLDVNPSVQLDVNDKSRVIDAKAINPDGETILAEMDLKNTDLTVAVNAIVGSLLRHGYVDELANSILVTVEDDNTTRAQQLQNSVSQQVTSALNSAQVNGAVISQTVSYSNNPLQAKADEYGISLGKATLIDSLVQNSDHLRFEDLVGLSVNELNLLASQQAVPSNNLTSNGSASSNGYIGIEAARTAAFQHAGVDVSSVAFSRYDFDYEMGRMVYEIEFMSGTVEYEYDIDAANGEVVKFSREDKAPVSTPVSTPVPTPVPTPTATAQPDAASAPSSQPASQPVSQPTAQSTTNTGTMLTAEQAKSTALNHAGLTAESVWDLSIDLDQKNGHTIFDVDFENSEAEYEYWIEAYTGEVLRSNKENRRNNSTSTATTASITAQQAKEIALQQAGLAESSIYDLEIELERENGTLCYKVEFESAGMDYEYEIDATTGAILSMG